MVVYWQSEAAHYPAVIDDHDSKDRYHLIYDDGYVHATLFFTGCCNHGILYAHACVSLTCLSLASILTCLCARIRESDESPFDPCRLAFLPLLRRPLQSALPMCSAAHVLRRAALL